MGRPFASLLEGSGRTSRCRSGTPGGLRLRPRLGARKTQNAGHRKRLNRLCGSTRIASGVRGVRVTSLLRDMLWSSRTTCSQELTERGIELDRVSPDRAGARRFVDAMPSADVSVNLHTAAHSAGTRQWTTNDIFDFFDALPPPCPTATSSRRTNDARTC